MPTSTSSRWCCSLDTIALPDRLERIGHDAFNRCALRSVFIPASVVSLTSTSVSYCQQLTRVVVSADNPVYDSRDGYNAIIETRTNTLLSASCTARIPRSVTSLSDEAFNFFYLDSLTIPRQITRIGLWTLACYIKRLYVESPVPPVFDSPAPGTAVTDSSALIFVPRGSLKAYQRADGWRQLSSRLRENP